MIRTFYKDLGITKEMWERASQRVKEETPNVKFYHEHSHSYIRPALKGEGRWTE